MDEEYLWDILLPELVLLFNLWSEPTVGLNQRQLVATSFAVRATRRCIAVDSLFKNGFYLESHALVRCGYEDWLYLAYMLNRPGSTRCDEFVEQIHKHDARTFDAFATLCGTSSAKKYFGEPPKSVVPYLGLPRSQTKLPSFSLMADDVGLHEVHNLAYTYLSGLTHPDARIDHIFDSSESIQVARIPKRSQSAEAQLALWLAWFTARIAVLACREFGVDQESFCDEHLLPIRDETDTCIETSVLVREAKEKV